MQNLEGNFQRPTRFTENFSPSRRPALECPRRARWPTCTSPISPPRHTHFYSNFSYIFFIGLKRQAHLVPLNRALPKQRVKMAGFWRAAGDFLYCEPSLLNLQLILRQKHR